MKDTFLVILMSLLVSYIPRFKIQDDRLNGDSLLGNKKLGVKGSDLTKLVNQF